MAGTFSLSAMGVRVDVEVSGDRAGEVLDALPSLWAECPTDGARDDPTASRVVRVVHDRDPELGWSAEAAGNLARPETPDLLQLVTQRVTVTAIDALAGRLHLLHAACLADPADGSAVAFAAPGGTGKTTLVRTLGPGRWYVTDETVAVGDDALVRPYPKPLSIRRAPDSLYKDETAPRSLGLEPPAAPVRLRALYLLDRSDTHEGPPVVHELDPLDALVALTPMVSHLPRMRHPLTRLDALCRGLGGLRRVTYRDAADLAPLVASVQATP